MDDVRIRRLILRELYDKRRHEPSAAIERSELAQHLGLTPQDARFHLGYLAEKGLVEISTTTVGQRVFALVHITAAGIDLTEDPNEFNNRFPPQIIIQNVLGDKLDIVIGDHASNVSVGKDVVHTVHFGADTRTLTGVCAKFAEDIRTSVKLGPKRIEWIEDQLSRLVDLLTHEDPDLGEIQRIKKYLAEQEGRPAVRTSVLFSHEVVARPIRRAVERLVGYHEGRVGSV